MSPRQKSPTKSELLQLQKLYRTDEKIGERLGGVPAYLVAYWRRKKNIPKYSLPKFSDSEIRNLWERFGDDDKCGLELGISKAAFYNWRRRYEIREKPAFLKLEQLELNFPGIKPVGGLPSLYLERTMCQKILAGLANEDKLEVGQKIKIEPDLLVAVEESGEVLREFKKLGIQYVKNPGKIVFALDSTGSDDSSHPAEYNRQARDFVRRQRIQNFFDVNRGGRHQVVVESGLIRPSQFAAGVDRQVACYGCLAALATRLTTDDAVELMAVGQIELTVPATVRVDINGRLHRSVSAIDVALHLGHQLAGESLSGKVVEYFGTVVSHMSIGERFALCSISSALDIWAAICHFDSITRRYMSTRSTDSYSPVTADKNAIYDDFYRINIDSLRPQIRKLDGTAQSRAVAEMEDLPINQVVLGGEGAGRFEDLRIAAQILKGSKVSDNCRMLVYPGSRTVYLDALKKGLIRTFLEAGAILMNPASRCDYRTASDMLADGERCLGTFHLPPAGEAVPASNQSRRAKEIYSCSAATAAASALRASVTDPTRYHS